MNLVYNFSIISITIKHKLSILAFYNFVKLLMFRIKI